MQLFRRGPDPAAAGGGSPPGWPLHAGVTRPPTPPAPSRPRAPPAGPGSQRPLPSARQRKDAAPGTAAATRERATRGAQQEADLPPHPPGELQPLEIPPSASEVTYSSAAVLHPCFPGGEVEVYQWQDISFGHHGPHWMRVSSGCDIQHLPLLPSTPLGPLTAFHTLLQT
ncbi:FANCD2 opposite strand protein isoform X2 [Sminthopsis crassicaudata]|uniref:FANCD2 opposite strand protein isoform X2 n=1 Tax=Sminthopsis crassicaudata TaxID=9301 RepID=UPI003D6948F5